LDGDCFVAAVFATTAKTFHFRQPKQFQDAEIVAAMRQLAWEFVEPAARS
jgi:hypothetical protein